MTASNTRLVTSAVDTLADAMRQMYMRDVVDKSIKSVLPIISSYSATTLRRIAGHPWTPPTAKSSASDIIAGWWDETILNDYMAVGMLLDPANGHPIENQHTHSWRLYSGLHPYRNDRDYPKERLSQLAALFWVSDNMQANGKNLNSKYIADSDLREFILHPSKGYNREDIVNIITANNVHDVNRIKDMLDFEVQSMSSGVL